MVHTATSAMQARGFVFTMGTFVFMWISKWMMGASQSKRLERDRTNPAVAELAERVLAGDPASNEGGVTFG